MEAAGGMMGEDPAAEGAGEGSAFSQKRAAMEQQFQRLLDKSTVYVAGRWIGFGVAMLLYLLRVYLVNGWYIVTYGLGIYLLNLFIGFLSPQIDPETEGPLLPTSDSSGEFRPFTRRVPEFKFWYKATKATVISFFMTFFEVFNVPVFWPILLVYFIALTFLTLKRQIKHMWKHKYLPWSSGKKSYGEVADGPPPPRSAE